MHPFNRASVSIIQDKSAYRRSYEDTCHLRLGSQLRPPNRPSQSNTHMSNYSPNTCLWSSTTTSSSSHICLTTCTLTHPTGVSGHQLRPPRQPRELHPSYRSWWSFRSQGCGHQLRHGRGPAQPARHRAVLQHTGIYIYIYMYVYMDICTIIAVYAWRYNDVRYIYVYVLI